MYSKKYLNVVTMKKTFARTREPPTDLELRITVMARMDASLRSFHVFNTSFNNLIIKADDAMVSNLLHYVIVIPVSVTFSQQNV